jgi:hypothetical protein
MAVARPRQVSAYTSRAISTASTAGTAIATATREISDAGVCSTRPLTSSCSAVGGRSVGGVRGSWGRSTSGERITSVSVPPGPAGETRWFGSPRGGEYRGTHGKETEMLVWLLVLLLVILAIGGGIALSKFLFLILVLALVVALVGAFGRSAT